MFVSVCLAEVFTEGLGGRLLGTQLLDLQRLQPSVRGWGWALAEGLDEVDQLAGLKSREKGSYARAPHFMRGEKRAGTATFRVALATRKVAGSQ